MPVKTPAAGDLSPIEQASRDEIAALQLERLKATLQRAYENVPHYRQAFDAKGVHPGDLRQLSGLAKFPFTVKADLRNNYPFGMFAVPRGQVARIHASSGTTGKPTVVGYTKHDIDTWAELVARSMAGQGTWSMCPTAMACSRAAWARTTGLNARVAPSSPCQAGRPRSRCS
jgi:phenylacetate-CoA ligase